MNHITTEEINERLAAMARRAGRLVWMGGRPVPDDASRALGPDHDWRAGLRATIEGWKR